MYAIRSYYGPLNEKQSRYVQFISSSEKNLLNIINAILDLSKAEAGEDDLHMEEFSADESIKKVISMVLPQILEKDIKLNYQSGSRKLWIRITSYNVCYTKLLRNISIN